MLVARNPVESALLPIRNATDRTLLRRFRDGEQDAASELYLRYAKRLQALADKQTAGELAVRQGADDIIQSVFRTFFRRAAVGQYDVVDGDGLWRLFLVIALNKIRNAAEFHRAKKRDVRRTKSANPELLNALSNRSDDEHIALTVLQMTVDEVLQRLPENNRRLIQLRIEGHSVGEIAEQTNRAQRTVERVLQKFRELLMSEIDGEFEA